MPAPKHNTLFVPYSPKQRLEESLALLEPPADQLRAAALRLTSLAIKAEAVDALPELLAMIGVDKHRASV